MDNAQPGIRVTCPKCGAEELYIAGIKFSTAYDDPPNKVWVANIPWTEKYSLELLLDEFISEGGNGCQKGSTYGWEICAYHRYSPNVSGDRIMVWDGRRWNGELDVPFNDCQRTPEDINKVVAPMIIVCLIAALQQKAKRDK